MNPMVFLVVSALGIISTASEPIYIERRTSDLDDVNTCLAEGYLKVKDDLDGMGGHAKTDAERLKCACHFFEATKKCFLRISLELGNQAPEMFRYSALYNWQHLVLAQKAGLCLEVDPGNLKKIGKGVLKEEPKLVNLEVMEYKTCVGKALSRCLINMERSFEIQTGNPSFYYIECYENEKNICSAPLLNMFVKYGKVLKEMRDALE